MKYTIELSEDQMRLIANCLEDISRFASGQSEMKHTVRAMLKDLPFEVQLDKRHQSESHLEEVKKVLLPDLHLNASLGYDGTEFIGNTYQIYRTILHQLAIDHNWDNVYSSSTLPSGNMGTIKITKSE